MDLSYLKNDYITLILLILFVLAAVVVCIYYGQIFMRVGRKGRRKKDLQRELDEQKAGADDRQLPPVSVVMVAHNEGRFLRDNLVYLLEQDYPDYEVVVVDYRSTDDTKFVLQVCEQNYPNLRTVSMPEDVNMFQGRKLPLSIGIRSAKHDVVLLTEADCKPAGFNWIRTMMKGYASKDTKIVLGCSTLRVEKGLLNLLQQYDNLCYSAKYIFNVMKGTPTTGTGRNMSYLKKFFFECGAFTSHYTETYGADDLFVSQNADDTNTSYSFAPEARVEVEPKHSMKKWRLVRRQRESTYRLHPMQEKLMNMVYPLALLAFYGAMAMLIVRRFPWYLCLALVVLVWAWNIICFYQLQKQFQVKKAAWFSPLMEIYFWFANNILRLSALFRKR